MKETPATARPEWCYEGTTYTLDLCDDHATMFERDFLGWVRMAREAMVQHAGEAEPKKWTPGKVYQSRENVVVGRRVIDLDAAADGDAEEESGTSVDPDEVADELIQTYSVQRDMAQHEVEWGQVVQAVRAAQVITSTDRPGVSRFIAPTMSVLVSDDDVVIGFKPRDPAEPMPRTPVAVTRKIERKGKRGGQGRIGPRTIEDIVSAIEATPGWSVEPDRRHYAVHGPNGERSTLPKSASDHRAALNAVSELRKIGLDLRAPAHAS